MILKLLFIGACTGVFWGFCVGCAVLNAYYQKQNTKSRLHSEAQEKFKGKEKR